MGNEKREFNRYPVVAREVNPSCRPLKIYVDKKKLTV